MCESMCVCICECMDVSICVSMYAHDAPSTAAAVPGAAASWKASTLLHQTDTNRVQTETDRWGLDGQLPDIHRPGRQTTVRQVHRCVLVLGLSK